MNVVRTIAVALLIARWIAQLVLERVNRRHARDRAVSLPEALRGLVDEPTYSRSVEYTLAKSRMADWESGWTTVWVLMLLLSGALPASYQALTGALGATVWADAAFLMAVVVGLDCLSWPLAWHAQFHLEERFGFNTNTPRVWWADRAKGLLLALVIGYPLIALILFLGASAGTLWWFWAWAAMSSVQLVMMVLGPVLILPWFNKFTPLPDGALRNRLFELARRAGFATRDIQVMDGSRRSRHSNAFFTGLGRFRRIVLFDTLVAQLEEEQIEAVVAHEIGHYKKAHIPKLLLWSTIAGLAGFYLLSVAANQPGFYRAFGFESQSLAPALLLFGLLAGSILFWVSPLGNLWSRRFEYAADAYAVGAMGGASALIGALRRLSTRNLSNLTPHPWYSRFYYSHPTLLEREQAMRTAETTLERGARL